MNVEQYINGIQHVGVPTDDLDTTLEFYKKLGFEVALQTVNQAVNERVAFFKLAKLAIEVYENHQAEMRLGAIDHMALDVSDIEQVYAAIQKLELLPANETIHFLPFWTNGVRFFTITGPNREKIEFSQYL